MSADLDLTSARNVRDVLLARADEHPDRLALVIARGAAGEDMVPLGFAEVVDRALRVAGRFVERFEAGSRIVLALPTGTEFVESYLGCLFAGMVAVPVPEPGGSAAARARIEQVLKDCRPVLTLVTERDLAIAADAGPAGFTVEAAVAVGPSDAVPAAGRLPVLTREHLGVLQYSSGATGDPKGVMVSHGNILANVEEFRYGAQFRADEVFGSWIPLHHDMGLFSFLSTALLVGNPCVLMPPADFVKRPISWLRLIDRHRITITAAPSFAYGLCLRMVKDEQAAEVDLSSLRYMFNGSEPIHVPTMRAFTERFAASGLDPAAMTAGYGLAEATVSISMRPSAVTAVTAADPAALERGEMRSVSESASAIALGSASDSASAGSAARLLVSCGFPFGCEAMICDPATGAEVPAGRVGELWLRGPSVAQGYWEKPEETDRVFHATPAGSPGDADWLRTGDLAALVAGEMVLTGRLKEMMVIRGRNIFPQDLEHEARAAHPLLADFVGAAFGVQAPEERVVLVHEINPKARPDDLPHAVAAVKQRLTGMLGAPVQDVVLLRRGAVRRTTSGKIQRSVMRALFLAGDLKPVYAELAPEVRELLPR